MSDINFKSLKKSMPKIPKLKKAPRISREGLINRFYSDLWTNFDGTCIKIDAMSSEHIKNAVLHLKKGNRIYKENWIKKFMEELKERDTQQSKEALTEILLLS